MVSPTASSQGAMEGARDAVAEVYQLRDHFFERHGVENAPKKEAMIKEAMEKALAVVENASSPDSPTPEQLFLKGHLLNVTSTYAKPAEDLLSRAVKLDPKRIAAWNNLGECLWKKGAKAEARTCFNRALDVERNADTLQKLSMLLRSLPTQSEAERHNNIAESLELAKEAIKLDLGAGHSWFNLGNAYLALFFARMETIDHIKQAMKAYKRAETDKKEAVNNPDLHMNRATIYEYQEDYSQAVEGFHLAGLLDPDWPEPKVAVARIKERMESITSGIENKGKLKTKRVSGVVELLKGLGDASKYLGIGELAEGVNDMKATRLTVLKIFETKDEPAQTFLAVDKAGDWCCVTVYNMIPDAVKMEDTIVVPEPFFRNVKTDKMTLCGETGAFTFPSIRVDNPVTLQVNGSALGESALARATLSISSAAATDSNSAE